MYTVLIIIGVVLFSAICFFVGVLFAKRNPRYMGKIDDAYMKGRTEAEQEIKDKLKQAEEYIKSKTGSIEVSPVSGNTFVKYLLRFGIPLAGVFGLVRVLKPDMIEAMLYKCCLVCVGYILAEFIWVIGYKRTFDRQEKERRITDVGRIAILVFRGLLLGSVIVSLTLGL
ncbi:MAG: hypothetical protein KA801_10455 [Syntrophorhabdaceae bacterium]|nr:hypothetical protein [Syntrophorhabdaceae bacterium]